MDGDGLFDVAIGAPTVGNPELAEGNVFIWFGRTTWSATAGAAGLVLDAPFDLADGRFGTAVD
ncbi:MAG TPA: hypothetical protein VML75_07655 [Kofleriaceae bacterium]|nr:hypothetical protein [Kofleriaceae bacterium]